jgi:hypothetical protein
MSRANTLPVKPRWPPILQWGRSGVGDRAVQNESPVGLDVIYNMAGWELFSYLLADDPGVISETLEELNRHEVHRVHLIADRSSRQARRGLEQDQSRLIMKAILE